MVVHRASDVVAAEGHTRDEILKYSRAMQVEYEKLCAALHGHDTLVESKPSHTRRAFEALKPIGQARTFIESVVAQRSNDLLKELFAPGEDCTLIADVLQTTEDFRTIFEGTTFGNDERIQHCINACATVEGVLHSVYRLETKVQAAHEATRARNAQLKRGVSDLSPIARVKIIAEIDEGENPDTAVEKLWQSFVEDAAGATSITGETFHLVINTFCEYVSEESRQQSERMNVPALYHKPDSPVLRQFVQKHMDPNGDHALTKEEFVEGAKKVVDDIEPPDQVKRKSLQGIRLSTSSQATDDVLEGLWFQCDLSQTGELSGEEYQDAMTRFCQYASDKSKEKADRLQIPKFYHAPDSILLRSLVKQHLDPNSDGSITREEFMAGAEQVMTTL